MSGIPNDFGYRTGNYIPWAKPPFLAKSIVLRPFGEYGLATHGYTTASHGGYGVNYQSSGSIDTPDLEYLWKNELQTIPDLEQILIAIYWYTPENSNLVLPAVGPEVQENSWSGKAPPPFTAGDYNASGAYQLTETNQVWPTPDDSTLVAGIQWLQSKGYKVGLIPINVFLSTKLYYDGGGEWEIDRSAQNWNDLTSYLLSYRKFITHYIDLCSKNALDLSLFSIGSGLRDLTGLTDRSKIPGIVRNLQSIATYCKVYLPNTQTTYLADLDEYYYPYLVSNKIDGALDPLWTYPDLDLIGINWFAPLSISNSENLQFLSRNVVRGEAYSYTLNNLVWRNSLANRLLSDTNNSYKTKLTREAIDPRIYGVKNVEDWLAFSHYIPIRSHLAGCTSPAGITDPAKICSDIQGNAELVSLQTPLFPSLGGIFESPPRKNAYALLDSASSCSFTFPFFIPDPTLLDLEFDYSLTPGQSGNIFRTSFGLSLDYLNGSAVLTMGSVVVPLFTAWEGGIKLIYQAETVDIHVNGAFVRTVTGQFQMPRASGSMTFGGWEGKVYYIKFMLGTGIKLSGGEFYFEDAYAGIRTAWKPGLKSWIAFTGYGSMEGTGVDPFTRPQTILWSKAASVPPIYPNEAVLNAAVFRKGYTIKDIQVPYGSSADIDWRYQALVLYSAIVGLMPAGPKSISVWFFDTRSFQAMTKTFPNGHLMFNDAYDAEINASLNNKFIVHSEAGQLTVYAPYPTIDNLLGLSEEPGELPRIRSTIVEPNVPQGSSMDP